MLKKGAVLGVLVAALSAGCAGDGGLSREEYVSKLNAMCEAFTVREAQIGEPRTQADLVEKGPRILAAFEQTIVDEVHTLEAPGEVAEQADRLVTLADQQRDVLAGLIDAATESNFTEVQRLDARNEALNTEARAIARELGAGACADRT